MRDYSDGNNVRTNIRFTPTQYSRIQAAIKYKAQTMQAFILAATMLAVEAVEREIRAEEEYLERKKANRRQQREVTKVQPVGLGIRKRQEEAAASKAVEAQLAAERAEAIDVARAQASQVIINNGSIAAPNAEVERFAVYVTSGPDYSRDERLKEAVRILGVTAGSDEERVRLADMLDARITAIDAANKPKSEGGILSMLKKELFG